MTLKSETGYYTNMSDAMNATAAAAATDAILSLPSNGWIWLTVHALHTSEAYDYTFTACWWVTDQTAFPVALRADDPHSPGHCWQLYVARGGHSLEYRENPTVDADGCSHLARVRSYKHSTIRLATSCFQTGSTSTCAHLVPFTSVVSPPA